MPKILLVENVDLNRDALSQRLALEGGYEVLVAANGAEAVEIARSEAPDLILMDLKMPVLDGYEATRQLKASPETKAIPVIAMTALGIDPSDRKKAMEAGCDAFVSKLIDFPRLVDKVELLREGEGGRAMSEDQTEQAGGGSGYPSEANRTGKSLPEELRTLPRALIGLSRALLDNVANQGSEKSCSYLGIQVASKRLLEFVNDVLSPTARVAASKPRLSHDLIGMTAGIMDCSSVLEEEARASGQADIISRLQEIRSTAERFLPLIDEVVNFSRIGAGEVAAHLRAPDTSTSEQDEVAVVDSLEDAVEEVWTDQGTLLIVDDNWMNRDVLVHLLERQGYTTAVAASGPQALEMIKKQKFDLMLLDLMMPEMDGDEVLECLRNNSHLPDIPVIMISAVRETKSVVECIKLGAEDYVTRPFDPVLLRARIETYLENKRLKEERQEFEEERQEFERFIGIVEEMNEEFRKRERQIVSEILESEGFKKVQRELDKRRSREDSDL